MIYREISNALKRYLKSFPVVLVTGARQVGKTTLLRQSLQNYQYVLLESPDVRERAQMDPRRFLEQNKSPAIFDEFQQVPQLTNYLQELVDANRKAKGQFVLTGSQNFLMTEQVSQSLAGRVGMLELYGLSSRELPSEALNNRDQKLGQLLLRGTYPELWSEESIRPLDWYGSYVQTYLERDVRRLANVGDLSAFERFIKVCAARTGQLLNYSDIAADSGVSPTTAQRWMSILQATYIIRLLPPYYENLSSRVRKAMKLYFLDTGLAAYLMGYRDPLTVVNSPQYGALFETLVYANFIKLKSAEGALPDHYYLETKSKLGVDLMVQHEDKFDIYEIKGAKTFHESLCEPLVNAEKALRKKIRKVILLGPYNESFEVSVKGVKVQIQTWQNHFFE